jgi:hypothetical protein
MEGLQNAPKYSLKSFSAQWIIMAAFGAKPFSQLEYPRNSAFGLETCFPSFHTWKAYEMLQNIPKHHFWSNGVEWMYLL